MEHVRGAYTISTDPTRLDESAVGRFLGQSYWAAGIPIETLSRSLAGSLCFGLFHGTEQVGFCRVVTDRATFAWLCDVWIEEAHRGGGLGQWLVETVLSHPDLQGLRRFLLATRDAHALYARCGFRPPVRPDAFMEIHRPDIYRAAAAPPNAPPPEPRSVHAARNAAPPSPAPAPRARAEQDLWTKVDGALEAWLAPADPALAAAAAAAAQAGLPEIAVAPAQGRFLEVLARATGARRMLEIGTLAGYSTIWLARALPADGRLVSLEIDPERARLARENLDRAGLAPRVEVITGPALESLAALCAAGAAPFDLVFVDADKQNSRAYVEQALALARPGTLVVVDNVVRDGRVIDPATGDAGVDGVRAMMDFIAAHPRLRAAGLQTVGAKGYDGMLLAVVEDAMPAGGGTTDGVDYRTDAPLSAAQLADLFRRSGIRRPVDDLPRLEAMIRHADLVVTAWRSGELVGVARSLTDWRYCCYLSDLAVDRQWQRLGIGTELLHRTKAAVGEESMLLLLSAPEAMAFYSRIGMDAVANGWIITRAG